MSIPIQFKSWTLPVSENLNSLRFFCSFITISTLVFTAFRYTLQLFCNKPHSHKFIYTFLKSENYKNSSMPYTRPSNTVGAESRTTSSFKGNTEDARAIVDTLLSRPRYVSVQESHSLARVTDRLRKDNPRWLSIDRNSMKNYVWKVLLTKDVQNSVQKHWENEEHGNESDEGLVSFFANFLLVNRNNE
jgi:hypothetical protein